MIKIGTRDSELAQWQAKFVQKELQSLGYEAELVLMKSEGDIDLTTPLAQMGGKGVFTKTLDDALLNNSIDIAVHSYKDLPTVQPLPLVEAAILKREDPRDVIVAPRGINFLNDIEATGTIATGSTRRKAQWLSRFPNYSIDNIRGNVNTRLRKVNENENWHGAIFAAAGLKRINLDHNISAYLDWMIPAPAQGVMAVVCHEERNDLIELLAQIECEQTRICTQVERAFLNRMEAGCSAPLGAYAYFVEGEEDLIQFDAIILSVDGQHSFSISERFTSDEAATKGVELAQDLIEQGADKLIPKSDEH